MEEYTVVDVETTGFGNSDRVVEIGIVVVDAKTLETKDEYETLINPERDVGPVHVHQITASMVSAAPVFSEVISAISQRLDSSVLVAHNLPFDKRMITNEYNRHNAKINSGKGICTLNLSGEKLNLAAARYGINLSEHHRALADARASAELLRALLDDNSHEVETVEIDQEGMTPSLRTLTRDIGSQSLGFEESFFQKICKNARFPSLEEAELSYLETLNWALDDLIITEKEREQLDELIVELNLSKEHIADIHTQYLESLVAGALRDHIITPAEYEHMNRVADLLNITEVEIPDISEIDIPDSFEKGARVCFTGTVVGEDGKAMTKPELKDLAFKRGLQPVDSVTKSGCDYLVASDPNSSSGKAKNARKFNKPIVDARDFLRDFT